MYLSIITSLLMVFDILHVCSGKKGLQENKIKGSILCMYAEKTNFLSRLNLDD